MSAQASHCIRLVGVFAITGFLAALAAAEKKIPEPLRIGLMNSLFRDAPDSVRQVIIEPFRTLTESQTGIKSELETAATAHELGPKLSENKIQLGVFNGSTRRVGDSGEQDYPEPRAPFRPGIRCRVGE